MKKYIDCDGVILDTERGLFDEYYELKKIYPELTKDVYLMALDWTKWINQAGVINDAIYLLKSFDYMSADIITRVHSLNEASVKINYFRSMGVKNNIIIVPNDINKSDTVDAVDSVLVDDSIYNLREWKNSNGIPIYFGNEESEFTRIKSLEEVLDNRNLKKILSKRK